MTEQPPPEMPGSPQPPPFLANPQVIGPYAPEQPKPRSRIGVLQILAFVFLGLSLAGNALLLVTVFSLLAVVGAGGEEGYLERVIARGPASNKIVVIHVNGIIDGEMADSLRAEMERAARDNAVRAVIFRINSPGGGLTASDTIHHDIRRILVDAGKPVIASMDSVAASGGYYVACAADRVVAQQTTVTGSIGVIAQFYFLNGLLQDRLGVTVVTLKMGQKKDWPNMFAATMTEEQREYMLQTLLAPGYNRFVDTVADARKKNRTDILPLATGQIFMAEEARRNGLIDDIGFFEKAVEMAKKRAGITEAKVVEYVRPFSLANFLGVAAKTPTLLDLRPERLAALATPRVMCLWTGF